MLLSPVTHHTYFNLIFLASATEQEARSLWFWRRGGAYQLPEEPGGEAGGTTKIKSPDFMTRAAENLPFPRGGRKSQAVNFLVCCRLLSVSSPCVCISVYGLAPASLGVSLRTWPGCGAGLAASGPRGQNQCLALDPG